MTKRDELIEVMAAALQNEWGCEQIYNGEVVFCDDPRFEGMDNSYGESLRRDICECKVNAKRALEALEAAIPNLSSLIDGTGVTDTMRLDWLDEVNRKTNERNGTKYGWRYDINHNRAALMDHNLPARSIREAIDYAMPNTHKTQQ